MSALLRSKYIRKVEHFILVGKKAQSEECLLQAALR